MVSYLNLEMYLGLQIRQELGDKCGFSRHYIFLSDKRARTIDILQA
jgi:hypothetical protein